MISRLVPAFCDVIAVAAAVAGIGDSRSWIVHFAFSIQSHLIAASASFFAQTAQSTHYFVKTRDFASLNSDARRAELYLMLEAKCFKLLIVRCKAIHW